MVGYGTEISQQEVTQKFSDKDRRKAMEANIRSYVFGSDVGVVTRFFKTYLYSYLNQSQTIHFTRVAYPWKLTRDTSLTHKLLFLVLRKNSPDGFIFR